MGEVGSMHMRSAARTQSGRISHALAWCTTSVRRLQAMVEEAMLVKHYCCSLHQVYVLWLAAAAPACYTVADFSLKTVQQARQRVFCAPSGTYGYQPQIHIG